MEPLSPPERVDTTKSNTTASASSVSQGPFSNPVSLLIGDTLISKMKRPLAATTAPPTPSSAPNSLHTFRYNFKPESLSKLDYADPVLEKKVARRRGQSTEWSLTFAQKSDHAAADKGIAPAPKVTYAGTEVPGKDTDCIIWFDSMRQSWVLDVAESGFSFLLDRTGSGVKKVEAILPSNESCLSKNNQECDAVSQLSASLTQSPTKKSPENVPDTSNLLGIDSGMMVANSIPEQISDSLKSATLPPDASPTHDESREELVEDDEWDAALEEAYDDIL